MGEDGVLGAGSAGGRWAKGNQEHSGQGWLRRGGTQEERARVSELKQA